MESLINVTIQDGKTAFLNCKINLLQDKTVNWAFEAGFQCCERIFWKISQRKMPIEKCPSSKMPMQKKTYIKKISTAKNFTFFVLSYIFMIVTRQIFLGHFWRQDISSIRIFLRWKIFGLGIFLKWLKRSRGIFFKWDILISGIFFDGILSVWSFVKTCFHNVQVSWVRRIFYLDLNDTSQERQELQLLTVGTNTFVADLRYLVDLQFPNNFRLQIRNVTKRDEGIYECQVCSKHNNGNLWLKLLNSRSPADFDASTESHSILFACKR